MKSKLEGFLRGMKMINIEDQNALFDLISKSIEKDISAIAIGGTAMMFSGYKTATKDIDLVFQSEEDRIIFINAIELLGYRRKSMLDVYSEDKQKNKNKPLMFSRGEERFDLFVDSVFGFNVKFDVNLFTQRHDFIHDNELILYVLPKEYLILLKAITSRDRDYEDIENIVQKEEFVDWDLIVNLAIEQKQLNKWILVDLEETLQKLKHKFFIKKKYFDMIYTAMNME